MFFDDTFYQKSLQKSASYEATPTDLRIWSSELARAGAKLYWKGLLKKGVDANSLKRISSAVYADKNNVYFYNLQNIKVIAGMDASSLIYLNKSSTSFALVSDKTQPIECYIQNMPVDERIYRLYSPLFEYYDGKISTDYWWHKFTTK